MTDVDYCPQCESVRVLPGPQYDRTLFVCLECGYRWDQRLIRIPTAKAS